MKHFGEWDSFKRRNETSELLKDAAASLGHSFPWKESAEGEEYWRDQYQHLLRLADHLEQDI